MSEDSYLQHFHKQLNFAKLWRKKSRLGTWNFRRIDIGQKSPIVVVQHIKNPAWAIKKQPTKRGKRGVHFRCFCIKCWNSHPSAGNTNSMKLSLMCPNMHFFFQWRWIQCNIMFYNVVSNEYLSLLSFFFSILMYKWNKWKPPCRSSSIVSIPT